MVTGLTTRREERQELGFRTPRMVEVACWGMQISNWGTARVSQSWGTVTLLAPDRGEDRIAMA